MIIQDVLYILKHGCAMNALTGHSIVLTVFKFIVQNSSFGTCCKFLLDGCQRTLLTEHCFGLQLGLLGTVPQQAITWANGDSYLCHQVSSLGHNELK